MMTACQLTWLWEPFPLLSWHYNLMKHVFQWQSFFACQPASSLWISVHDIMTKVIGFKTSCPFVIFSLSTINAKYCPSHWKSYVLRILWLASFQSYMYFKVWEKNQCPTIQNKYLHNCSFWDSDKYWSNNFLNKFTIVIDAWKFPNIQVCFQR